MGLLAPSAGSERELHKRCWCECDTTGCDVHKAAAACCSQLVYNDQKVSISLFAQLLAVCSVERNDFLFVLLYLLHADQGHLLPGYRLLDGQGGHGFDENHASLLQSQRAGQGVGTVGSLGGRKAASRAGARDQAQVLQGEVDDGRTGAVEAVGLLGGVWRGGCSGGFVEANAGGCNLLGYGGSGAC